MNDPTINSPLGVRPEYDSLQCNDVMPRVGTDSEGKGLTAQHRTLHFSSLEFGPSVEP